MNPTENVIPQIIEYIQKGTAGIIVLPANPTTDAVASATSLYLGLTKAGKNITIACSTPVNTEVTASDKIQNTFITKGDNLVISFPYTDGSIDKVDYNIQGSTFNLIITPRQGQPKLDAQKVAYSYTGGKVDFIITVDAPSYNALGQIYQENQAEFDGRPVINIDRHLVNNMFGTVNYVNKTASSTSELVLKLLMSMQIEIDRDMATNMYTGLTAATNYFTSYSVVPGTFEAAAQLLKLGAQKKPPAKPQQTQSNNQSQQAQNQQPKQNQPVRQPAPQQQSRQQVNQPQQAQNQQPQPQAQPAQNQPQTNNQPSANQQPEQPQPIAHAPQQPQQAKPQEGEEPKEISQDQPETPQDWLKPKIFRSGGLL